MANTGKTPCKYGPVFAPYLHDWTLYGINTVQNGSVFTWRFSCVRQDNILGSWWILTLC